MQLLEHKALTFDDVLIVPSYSDIESRNQVSLSQNFLGLSLDLPIISANMDYITASEMGIAMLKAGGFYIYHRFIDFDFLVSDLHAINNHSKIVSFSIGTRDIEAEIEKTEAIVSAFPHSKIFVTVDVAHGHHSKVVEVVKKLKSDYADTIKIIAGNVATAAGFRTLALAGADAIKVGIGPGSVCTTRTVTGVGFPQLTAIDNCSSIAREMEVQLIADGGIKNSGDIVKALAAGADVVMVGSLLSGTNECPGEVRIDTKGKRWRPYRGQSIFGTNDTKYTKEGIEGWVQEKGPVADVLRQLAGGMRSGLSYVGARNLEELRANAIFVEVSPHTALETHTRITTEVF